jgi:hypothetical protein
MEFKKSLKKEKVVHMQNYDDGGNYNMFTFCDYSVAKVNVTTQWKNCTCKQCLRFKMSAGKPA